MPAVLALWIACQTFDTVSTEIAVRQVQASELNPLVRHGRLPIKVGVNVAGIWAYRKSHKAVIPVVFAVSGCTAGVLNTRVLTRAAP